MSRRMELDAAVRLHFGYLRVPVVLKPLDLSLHCRDISPEISQAVVGAKQRAEDRGISEQNIAGAIAVGRHPEEHVEFGIALFEKRMRPRLIDWLFRQHAYRSVIRSDCVMRQVHVEIERG